MARPRRADVGEPLEEALAGGGQSGPPEAPGATGGRGKPRRPIPELPTSTTGTGRALETSSILLHGAPGIGKSTLASQFPGFLFLDCAGELKGLDVYSVPVADWAEFRDAGHAVLEDQKGTKRFKGVVIDTVDALFAYVRASSNANMGISHESQAGYGQGWDAVKAEFVPRMTTLSSLPDFGVIWVAHSKTVEIKTRRAVYDRWVPDLPGALGSKLIQNADLILFLDHEEDEDGRTIYTKPNPYHEAKERGENPMLPEQVAWPLGTNGYQALADAWGKVNE